tara:strand:- start:247 stop:615 length:369 start_codon:yes stop_codon:yes gene_type:complete
MNKLIISLLLLPIISFASFPIKTDTLTKKETVEEYHKRINKKTYNSEINYDVQEVKPFIDVKRVPKNLWFAFLFPPLGIIALYYIIFAYGNNFAKVLGILMFLISVILVISLFKWANSLNFP